MQCKKPLCLHCCGLTKSWNNILYPGFFGGRQDNWDFDFLGMCRVQNSWLQDGICSCTDTSPGAVSQGNALQLLLFGVQCWGCSSSPLLSSWPVLSPGRCLSSWYQHHWLACPPCWHLSVCPGFQRQSEAPFAYDLARSWVLLPMWIQSLLIFRSVQKHEPPGFCSCYLWLLFRYSSTSLHLCSLSCQQKLKGFLIGVQRAQRLLLDLSPFLRLFETGFLRTTWNRFLKMILTCWGVDVVKVRCTSVSTSVSQHGFG